MTRSSAARRFRPWSEPIRSRYQPASLCRVRRCSSAMAHACETRAGAVEPFVDTIDTARDMDRIRQALGLSKISFYGLSYGTVLGTVYADLFPHRVAEMVLDGAVDVNATLTEQAGEAAPAEERSLLHLFATCLPAFRLPAGA